LPTPPVEDLGVRPGTIKWRASALLYLIDEAVADNVLTADEDARIEGVAALVKLEPELAIRSRTGLAAPDWSSREPTDGRLPRIREPSVRLSPPGDLLFPGTGDAAVTGRRRCSQISGLA
jgi:hypothetical protein